MEKLNYQAKAKTSLFAKLSVSKGFTLVELMITITVAGVLTAIAVPSLSTFTIKMRVDNEVSEIQRLLLTARNAAINSGQNAQLCPLAANDTCQNTTNWTGRIGVVSADGLIREKSSIKNNDQLVFTFNNVTYNPAGQLAFSDGNTYTFSYCPNGNPKLSRGVIISLSGRSSLSSDNNGDGRDQDRTGNNISCP